MAPLYLGSLVGNMFSTINAFQAVLGSYSAGINFIEGLKFRTINFIIGDIITIIYFIFIIEELGEMKQNQLHMISEKI